MGRLPRTVEIARAEENLFRCYYAARDPSYTLEERKGATLGECDWYAELHRLLYEEEF